MTIREIVQEYLQNNGYDGLAGDNCGCSFLEGEKIMPCAEGITPCDNPADCLPGHQTKCVVCGVDIVVVGLKKVDEQHKCFDCIED